VFAKFKQLAGQSSLYTIGEVLRSSLSFLLLPIYTRLLSPADYAILGVMSPIFALLSALMALGLPAALVRFYFDYQDDPATLRRYIGTITIFGVSSGLLGSLLLTLLGPTIFGWLLPNTPFHPFVLITIWNAGITVVSVLALQLFRARQQAQYFISFSLVDFGLTTVLIILFVVALGLGVLGSLWGQLLAAVVMAAPALWVLARASKLTFSWPLLRTSLRFSLPLLPFILGTWALNVSDRIVLDGLVSREALGLYTLGYQFGILLNLIAMALNNAWQPFFYQNASDRKNDAMIGSFITYQVALMVMLALAVALLSPELIRIIAAPAYWSAAAIVPWIAAGYVARYLYFFPVNSLLFRKRTGWVAALTILAAALNIGLNVWLAPRFGIMAAAVNTLVAFVVLFIMAYVVGQRVFPVQYQWGRLLLLFGLALALFGISLLIPTDNLLLSMALKLALLAALPALLWLTGFLTTAEKARVKQVVGRLVNR
jgi:O-antigen/teichoic acid export membrane protein